MPVGQRKPSIQPRPTKASMLRTQKQPTSSTPSPTEPKVTPKPTPVNKSTVKSAGPTEGIKAFMAQQRARMSVAKQPSSRQEEEHQVVPKSSKVMTGAQRYGGSSATEKSTVAPRRLDIVIKQAKGSGKLNISSRNLDKIPDEVINMYHVDPNSIVVDFSSSGDAWYDVEELTKFIAGDNQITEIDERLGKEFAALKQIDFRVNKLRSLPDTIELLQNLTSVLLPYNEFEDVPNVLFKLKNLKELDISHNHIHQISLPDTPESSIENLDLSHNTIKDIHIPNATTFKSLVKLNLSHNKIEQLPEAILHATRLQELQIGQNRLRVLFDGETTLPSLVRLYANDNQLTQISTGNIDLPKLVEVSLGNNRMTEEGMIHLRGAPNILTLDISSNKLQDIPLAAIVCLTHLQRLDVRANDIHQLPCELGQLDELNAIYLEGNPMRISSSMTHLIESLKSKYKSQQQESKANSVDEQSGGPIDESTAFDKDKNEKDLNDTQSQKQKVDIAKKLIMSNKQLKELSEKDLDFSHQTIPGTVLLDHNLLSTIPFSLSCVSEFLVKIDLDYNCIEEFSLTIKGMVFPNLKSLRLSQNRMKQLTANGESSFPHLEELVLNNNLLTSLPSNMASILPELKTLSISSNKLDNISIDMFGKKLEILNLSNNDIGHLPPELSTITTLKELVVFGNRFRVPRPAIVDQGTQAVLEFLRHRVRN